MPHDDRGFAIPLVVVIGALVVAVVLSTAELHRGTVNLVHRSMAGHDLELVLVQAIEEAHYRLMMSHTPSASTWGTGSRMRELAALGPQGPGTRSFPEPGQQLASGTLSHDAALFLRDSRSAVWFVPEAMVASLGTVCGIDLAPVKVRVVDRESGPAHHSPPRDAGDPPDNLLAQMGLPPGMTELTATWGVLELVAEGQVGRGLRTACFRRCTQRKLFVVVDFMHDGERPSRHAVVFGQPLGQVMQREP